MRYVYNLIASVGRQIDVYRPIKIQKSYRPTVCFNVITALRLTSTQILSQFAALRKDTLQSINFSDGRGLSRFNDILSRE